MSARATTGLLLAGFLMAGGLPAQSEPPVVRAVLFYSPTCPHCHTVMNRDLPPLLDRFGDRLTIVAINVATPSGGQLYEATILHYAVPQDRLGVPALLVGDTLLVGSGEIPARLPAMVEAALAARGTDWPPVTALQVFLKAEGFIKPPQATSVPDEPAPPPRSEPAAPPAAVAAEAPAPTMALAAGAIQLGVEPAPALGWRERFLLDRAGNSTAVVVLLLLVAVVGLVLRQLFLRSLAPRPWPDAVFVALAVLGTLVALYLAYIEVTGREAVCGPVGDCNTVQQSPQARLFGIVPIGVLGVAGYLAILAGHLLGTRRALRITWILAFGGVLFSIYLTFLEPFVIGASCAWCLSSAVIMALILVDATTRARHAGAI